MVVPCPPQPIAERDHDCWCEELVDVEELHEESTLCYAWQRADLILYQPEDVRDARRADATPLARAWGFQCPMRLYRGAGSSAISRGAATL
jgi:hypothetical protein